MLQCLKREPGFYRYLWGLTGPIALQNLITFTLGLMDTLMVSWLGNTQMAAVTTAMGLAWKSGVAAEVLCIPRPAIGTQIYNSKLYLDIPDLFAWTVAVVLLSLALEWLLRRLLERDKRRGAAHALP